jgi:predicted RNase H-like HicB family nuclease
VQSYTAKYVKLSKGYMGQIVEWPEVVTEGKDIEECRSMLKDALHQMVLAYGELGKPIPQGSILYEQLPVDLEDVRKTA